MKPFSRYELRTKDPDAARKFYAAIFPAELDITRLPERAQAAGAPSHWLGHIEGDVERAIAAGAQRIVGNVLRDPLGAVFAIADAKPTVTAPEPPIMWHQLNTTDVARARSFYATTFDWPEPEAPNVTILDLANNPRVHTAWLLHFAVDDLESVTAKVKEQGGLVAGVFDLPGGDRLAVCDDPQGAMVAFRSAK